MRLTATPDVDASRHGASTHLDVLEQAGLVASTRRGKYKVLGFVGTDHATAAAWLDRLAENDTNAATRRS